MSELILGAKTNFDEYQGFIIHVGALNKDLDEYIGVAVEVNGVTKFAASGKSRNEVGRELESYVNLYRQNKKEKLIIS